MPDFTPCWADCSALGAVPAIVNLLASARKVCPAESQSEQGMLEDTRPAAAALLLPLMEVLLGGQAVNARPEEAWALACLSVWPDVGARRISCHSLNDATHVCCGYRYC